jgi:hypothetical protein
MKNLIRLVMTIHSTTMQCQPPPHFKFAAVEVRLASVTGSPLHELLAAVDVVSCSGDRRVRHEVDGEHGDVGRADHAPDRQRRAELLATRVQLIAEQRCQQRRVDEAGRDKVDADGSVDVISLSPL